jgi:hypothetical protein
MNRTFFRPNDQDSLTAHPPGLTPQAVVDVWHRRPVADDQHRASRRALAQEAQDALLRAAAVEPFAPRRHAVELVQGRLAPVQPVQVQQPVVPNSVLNELGTT